MRTTISVVIPVYNSAQTIARALASVANQSLRPDEIIVVDDGSTDGGAVRIAEAGRHIQLIRQANGGSAAARQAGTEAAAGTHIAYLDADDWWPKTKLEACAGLAQNENVEFLFGDLQRAFPHDPPERYLPRNVSFYPWIQPYFARFASESSQRGTYRLESARGLELLLNGFPVFPSTVFAKKSAIQSVGGWDRRFRRSQDFDIGLRVARRFPIHFATEVQALLGLHAVNQDENSYLIKQTTGDIAVLDAHRVESTDPEYRGLVKRALAKKYCHLGYVLRHSHRYAEARRAYKSAFELPGRRVHSALRMISASLHL
jgi:glycosyltransferase involved in cell wall biosynthesis